MPGKRFLECFYRTELGSFLENTRFAHHFRFKNIPFGIASGPAHEEPGVAIRYEDLVFFLDGLAEDGYFRSVKEETLRTLKEKTLNSFAALPKSEQKLVRDEIQAFIKTAPQCPPNCLHRTTGSRAICHISSAKLYLPFTIRDFTDFSCSENHVLNASEAIFNERIAPPGFYNFPVGYSGRTSSIVVSGTPVIRPWGQYRVRNETDPCMSQVVFRPTKRMDFELEVAAFVGKASEMGKPVSLEDAEEHIFGLVLLNDWSARDIQALEMKPLGPLNGKSFCTTISPWVVTTHALASYKVPGPSREPDVELAPYLQPASDTYNFDLTVEICYPNGKNELDGSAAGLNDQSTQRNSNRSQELGDPNRRIACESQFSSLYWTMRDLVAQQTANGCNLNIGDLLATGTISGPSSNGKGCLMEYKSAVDCETTSTELRDKIHYLGDGDSVILTGIAGPGVGFGECVGTIKEAIVHSR